MIPSTYLVVTESPVLQVELEKWGLRHLAARKMSPVVWDVSMILFAHVKQFRDVSYDKCDYEIRQIDSVREFQRRLRELPSDTFVFWNLPFAPKTEALVRALGRSGLPFCLQRLAPTLQASYGQIMPPAPIGQRLVGLLRPWRLRQSLGWRLFHLRRRWHRQAYPRPAFVLAMGPCDEHTIDYPNLAGTPVYPANCEDFDRYLLLRDQKTPSDNTCVAIESATGGKVEYEMFRYNQPSAKSYRDTYYDSLRRIFDKVEAETRLRVVVAEHPRYSDAESARASSDFGDREVVSNETPERIARASLVLTRGSNAINFAVLFGKPVIIAVPTQTLHETYVRKAEMYARALGTNVLDLDDAAAVSAADFRNVAVDGAAYRAYRERFISKPGTPAKHSWEFLCDAIETVDNGGIGLETTHALQDDSSPR